MEPIPPVEPSGWRRKSDAARILLANLLLHLPDPPLLSPSNWDRLRQRELLQGVPRNERSRVIQDKRVPSLLRVALHPASSRTRCTSTSILKLLDWRREVPTEWVPLFSLRQPTTPSPILRVLELSRHAVVVHTTRWWNWSSRWIVLQLGKLRWRRNIRWQCDSTVEWKQRTH